MLTYSGTVTRWKRTMERDLNKIKQLALKREDENWEFRTFLKGLDMPLKKMDRVVHRIYEEVSSEIDCKKCANCCREVPVALDQHDINRFSNGLEISPQEFQEKYLVSGEATDEFHFGQKPCPFLKGNLCSNYRHRPKACRSYPHLQKKDFVFRLIGVIQNYAVCPIVFNVYEGLKRELWHNGP